MTRANPRSRPACAAAALACAVLLAAPAAAKTGVSLDVTRHQLSNGLTILTLEDHSAPLITYQTWYRVGSRNERPGITGLSHFLEHLMFDGAKKYGPKEFDRVLQKAGGVNNAFTSEDMTVYYESVSGERLDLVLDLEADRMADLLLTPEIVEAERGVVKEERLYSTDEDPLGLLYEQFSAVAYDAHPYLWPILGWMSDIEAWTTADVRRHYETHYAPNNATVILVGDFDTPSAVARIESRLGPLPRREPPPPVVTVEPAQRGERRLVVRKDVQSPMILMGFHIPSARDSSLVPLEVLQAMLTRGESSRLYRRLVYEDQLALWVQCAAERRADPSLFWIAAQARPGADIAALEEAIREELARISTEVAPPEEVSKAGRQIAAQRILALESVEDRAVEIGRYEILTGDWRNLLRDLDHYDHVGAGEVLAVAARTFHADNRTVAILIPAGEGTPETEPDRSGVER
jgi:zinc protease